jgi:cardiolipin synthase
MAGVKAHAFYRIRLLALANRLNYRNHRKIIIVDGITSFVGGINISSRYTNKARGNKHFWRDTHLRIAGPATAALQHVFICDWNFCAPEKLGLQTAYFPPIYSLAQEENQFVQIVSSGPDSERPSIYHSLVQAILAARREILLTTPYFVPGETIMDALVIASLAGTKVRLLVPGISDSYLVNAAARSYYTELLKAGVEIFLYQKGFVHAKTFVADNSLSMVGTANLDYRSFDLNFEVNALVYDEEIASKLKACFEDDIQHAHQLNSEEWLSRAKAVQFAEKVIRLMSPLL